MKRRFEARAIHQVLPSLHVADASGAHTLHAQEALREAGYASELFVENVDAPLSDRSLPFDQLDSYVDNRTVLLYQMAVGSVVADRLVARTEPLFVNYHNLTPADFFWEWAPNWLDAVEWGRQQLHRMARRVSHAIAVSSFNEKDLWYSGYRSTSVVPPFVDATSCGAVTGYSATLTGASTARSDGADGPGSAGARWLFVGKMLPHKAAHDIVRAFALYRDVYDPAALLALVGGQPVPAYTSAVRDYAASLGVADSVLMPGSVSTEQLTEEYSLADVFVCLSDHEGFCFPLLEAMQHEVPVVAFAAAAVPDTLGNAGVLLSSKDAPTVCAAVHQVVRDTGLRERLVVAGIQRTRVFSLAETKLRFVSAVENAIDRL